MRKLLALLTVLSIGGMAHANLLTNGDFSLDDGVDPGNAANWYEWTTNGWANRETSANGTYGDPSNYHYALGANGAINEGVWQDTAVPDDGATYELTADVELDNWWKPDGYVKLEFLDASDNQLGFDETWIYANGYDAAVNQPWQPISVSAQAPAGTVKVRSILAGWTAGDGGTIRYDNASLIVVPEPASLGLLAIGALAAVSRCRT